MTSSDLDQVLTSVKDIANTSQQDYLNISLT